MARVRVAPEALLMQARGCNRSRPGWRRRRRQVWRTRSTSVDRLNGFSLPSSLVVKEGSKRCSCTWGVIHADAECLAAEVARRHLYQARGTTRFSPLASGGWGLLREGQAG